MPPGVLAQMRPTWDKVWFPPRPFHISTFDDVFVVSEGLVVTRDGELVAPTVTQHTADAIKAARESVKAVIAGRECRRISDNVVLCRKPGCATYGHWLVEMLPWIVLASRWPEPVQFLVQELGGAMPSIMRQSFALLGIDEQRVLQAGFEPVRVERLIVVHGLTEHGLYMSPVALDCLQAITEQIAPSGPDAIFLTRSTLPSRRLVDEAQVLDDARRAGFVVVDPATMPLTEQVALFKAARRIVGVMGSALANLAFASPRTEVFVLAPDNMPDTFFWFLAAHRRLAMTEIRCRTAPPRTGHAEYDLFVQLDEADQALILDRTINHHPPPLWFDAEYYCLRYPDVAAAGVDPLAHYIEFGWRENRRPSEIFDGVAYLKAYDDVRAAGIDPLVHYLRFGRREGRRVASGGSLA